jgi:hypothetical protein
LMALLVAYRITDDALRITRYSSLVMALLALQLLVMNTRWLVNDSYLDEPPDRVANFTSPPLPILANESFGNQIALRGYDLSTGDHSITVSLLWQATAQPAHAYTVFVHVIAGNGQQVGQVDSMPVDNQSITSCWQPGEFILDTRTVNFDSHSPAPYTLEVGLYVLQTGDRLSVDNGLGTSIRLKVP